MSRKADPNIQEPFGFLVVDKPGGMTSHDVVARVRYGTHVRRIGHAGTLDPMATGILVLCLGMATRLSEYVMASTKRYTATIRLGVETETYDATGHVTSTADASHLTRERVEAALAHFQGRVKQIPPMFSALKHEGKRLYDLARAGKEIEREARTVALETRLISFTQNDGEVVIDVTCSAGTYVRSIAHDVGALLGVGGHLTRLRREASGSLHDPLAWDALEAAINDGSWQRYLIDERVALSGLPEIKLDQDAAQAVCNGRIIERSDPATSDGVSQSRAYGPGDSFLGILAPTGEHGERWKPEKIFLRPSPKSRSEEPGS